MFRSPIFLWDLVIGAWDLIGIWLLGHWSLVIGHWSLVIFRRGLT
jgi:hypothetical protein